MAEKQTLSAKIAELDSQVEWFYSESFELEKAVEKYKSAVKLAKEIEKQLIELTNEIEVVAEDFNK